MASITGLAEHSRDQMIQKLYKDGTSGISVYTVDFRVFTSTERVQVVFAFFGQDDAKPKFAEGFGQITSDLRRFRQNSCSFAIAGHKDVSQ